MVDYYELLGVPPSASKAELKSAYKARAMQYHPDKNAGDPKMEELFKQINEAYQVLSNSYKRSKYDMLLRYGRQQPIPVPQNQQHRNPHSYRGSSGQYRRPIQPQMSNLKATVIAFVFAFSVALVFFSANYIWSEHKAGQRAVQMELRRTIFESAVKEHEQGDDGQCLVLLDELGFFKSEEHDMQEFRDQLMLDFREKGNAFLAKKEYRLALLQYQYLEGQSISNSIAFMKKKALAYQGIGDLGEALAIYQSMHLKGYQSYRFYYELGMLLESKPDMKRALNYYKIGAELAASDYERTIGKAYPIMINASMIPPRHYALYMKVAQAHLALGQFEEAITAVAWPKEIWRDSLLHYQIEASSYRGLGDLKAMNESIRQAQSIDANFSLD